MEGDLLMIFIPGIVNFLGLAIVGIAYKLLVKENKTEQEDYSAYRSAHSL